MLKNLWNREVGMDELETKVATLEERQKAQDDKFLTFQNLIKEDLKEIKDTIARIEKRQVGNGVGGYGIRIDRLEQSERIRNKRYWWLLVPISLSIMAIAFRVVVWGF